MATLLDLRRKFNVSDLLMRQATGWLRAKSLVIQNGAHIALSQSGRDFHAKRKALLDD